LGVSGAILGVKTFPPNTVWSSQLHLLTFLLSEFWFQNISAQAEKSSLTTVTIIAANAQGLSYLYDNYKMKTSI
jgi:hypothetical protein